MSFHFLSPTAVGIVPIGEAHIAYAKEIQKELLELNIDSEVYEKNESLSKKIRIAEKQKLPMILVLGDDEVVKRSVALRDRRAKEQKNLSLDEFIKLVKEKMSEVHF